LRTIVTADDAPHAAAPNARRATRAMTDTEIETFMASARWATLATIEDDGPYAVPVAFGYESGVCYIATGAGRKADNIRRNPAVCLSVVEVLTEPDGWRSVVVRGRAEEVTAVTEKIRGFLALRRQFGRRSRPDAADLRRFAAARLLRVTADSRTGRMTP
jgi:nitroimidazol reductase NimA-like FMN-containing flavoprotein (pyridoxamine 5'-phosphate oxidase superfamily)